MSRRAIISDIHSNLVALEAVLADIKSQNVDSIVCLGDICGYGPQPVECIDRVREVAAWTLRGNHDEALFIEPRDFGTNARLSIEWQRRLLQPNDSSSEIEKRRWEWLKSLPPSRAEKDVLFVHASPRDPVYEYILREDFHDSGLGPTQKAKDIFASMDWLCFCGHSHRPGVVAEDFKWWRPSELENGSSFLRRGFKTIVNVGSVGQPRDGIPAACYVIFDLADAEPPAPEPKSRPATRSGATLVMVREKPSVTETQRVNLEDTRLAEELSKARDTALLRIPKVTFRRVDYDIEEAQRRFRAVKELPENNALRLPKGT